MKTKSIRIYEQGSYDVLKIEETNLPILKSNEVLIKHHYLGLNYIDINQRNGSYKIKELPTNVGMEASGIIEEVGKDVKRFKVCLLYTSPSPRDKHRSRMPSSA